MADAGFDWLLIDGEHAPLEVPTIVDQLRVIEPTGTPAIVRPAWNDPVILKRVLDTGAQTLLVPYVQDAEEARVRSRQRDIRRRALAAWRRLIRANRYGRIADYHARANDQICVLVQLETGEAVARSRRSRGWMASTACSSARRTWPPAWGTWGTTPIPTCAA